MRRRPSSRLLVVDASNCVLLFRFVHRDGPLAGREYWATPGGALETFADAARRELFAETGIRVHTLGPEVAEREFVLQLADGEYVVAEERFFLVHIDTPMISRDHWTANEIGVMAEHRWWSLGDLESTGETVFPEALVAILTGFDDRAPTL